VAAALRGDRLAVTVADDGAGLDIEGVRAQLRDRGREVPDTDREVVRLLFQGGLSTRAEATAISGRGVGLDLVRAALDRVGGVVDVRWTPGAGTTFALDCPLSLATLRVLLAAIGPQPVAIPTMWVERLHRIRLADVKQVEGRAVIAGEPSPTPLVPLARLLPPLPERPAGDPVPVVVVAAGEQRLALSVDELVAEQEVVVQPVESLGIPMPLVAGGALLGNGRVALVLNPPTVLEAGLGSAGGAGPALAPPSPARARPTILVVDDSITTRTLEQSVLDAAGYEVVAAVDGAEAWKLLQERHCDLVVADVEMPRMDGFELCQAIRGSKRLRELPIVLVTAMETPEHRARGLEVGADAYIGKSDFDQQGLLDIIRQLLE
jgi:two-component system chemotaxis sensor kinase CheA